MRTPGASFPALIRIVLRFHALNLGHELLELPCTELFCIAVLILDEVVRRSKRHDLALEQAIPAKLFVELCAKGNLVYPWGPELT